jgi:hypothetical protein
VRAEFWFLGIGLPAGQGWLGTCAQRGGAGAASIKLYDIWWSTVRGPPDSWITPSRDWYV